jgi:hypothetical protein
MAQKVLKVLAPVLAVSVFAGPLRRFGVDSPVEPWFNPDFSA